MTIVGKPQTRQFYIEMHKKHEQLAFDNELKLKR